MREVDVGEELARIVPVVEAARERFPELVLSVDTWRSEVADVVCRAGADVLNDAWAAADPRLVEVVARHDVGLVCSHTGGLAPRKLPHRVWYDDVVSQVRDELRLSPPPPPERGYGATASSSIPPTTSARTPVTRCC